MSTLAMEALAPMVREVNQRSRELVERIALQVNIDWGTGQVNIRDEMAILNAFLEIGGADARELAQNYVEMLKDGYAVLDLGTAGNDIPFGIPWRALLHAPTITTITGEGWDLLGIKPWSTANSIRQTWMQRHPQVPRYMLDSDERLNHLAEWAARRAWLDRLNPFMLPKDGAGGADPRPDPAEPLPPRNNPPSIDPATMMKSAIALAKAGAECLAQGQWSVENFFGFSVGVKVCLDRACADKLQDALLANAGSILSDFFISAVKIGISAALEGMISSVGGWATLAMFHFCAHWATLIWLNKTANGVCLIHFWPWHSQVLSAFTGGLPILNGYAVGR